MKATIEHMENGMEFEIDLAETKHDKNREAGEIMISAEYEGYMCVCTGRENCTCDACHDSRAYYQG